MLRVPTPTARHPASLLLAAALAVTLGSLGAVVLALPALGLSPLVGLLALAAAASLPFLVNRPLLVLVVLASVELSNAGEVLGRAGVPGLYVATLLLALSSAALGVRRGTLRLAWSPVYLTAAIFIAVRAASVLVAEDAALALGDVLDTGKSLLFLLVAITLASAPAGPRILAVTTVAVVASLAGLSLVQEFGLGNATEFAGLSNVPKEVDEGGVTARHAGPLRDANFWGRVLVLFVPLTLSLWAGREPRRWRWLWVPAVVALCGGVYLTGSRGGLIALVLSSVAWLAMAGSRYRRLLLLAPVLVAGALVLPGVGSRLATLTELGESAEGRGDISLSGRLAVQKLGVEMVLDRPTTGVGARNFKVVQPEYARRSGLRPYEVLAPHNIYLEMAAEGGLPGLAAWALFYGSAVFVSLRAMLVWPRAPDSAHPPLEQLLAAGAVAALVGWAVASLFLHLAQFRSLLLVVALGAALDVRAAEAAAAPSGVAVVTSVTDRARPRLRLPIAVAALSFAVALGCALSVFPIRRQTWEGRARAAVVPVVSHRQPYAYEYDVASRRGVVDTHAAIVASRRFRDEAGAQLGLRAAQRRDVDVAVRGSAVSAIIDVSVRSPDRLVASSMAGGILERGSAYIDGLDRLYVLRPVTPAPATVRSTVLHPPAVAAAVLAAVSAALAALAIVMMAVSFPRRGPNPASSPKAGAQPRPAP